MKNIKQSRKRRSAVILGMAALFALLCGGCGAGTGASKADPAASGETLVVIGPGAIHELPSAEPETTASAGQESTQPALPETTETETPEPPSESTETTEEETAGMPVKPGLWAEVPTDSADWATRAVSDVIYYLEDFGFATYVSSYDADGDGVEDQADLLQGAKDYVATRPVYDSGYFAGGWPPEGKGVCSDVIAYALKAAGYDLQKLVDDDVVANPEIYSIKPGDNDPNIDYRRTRNLLPFFERFAESLTTDPYDYEAWQPGDIVIFESPKTGMWPGHIAVVSDRRASDGLPYLIHHTDNDRTGYEEDFLTTPLRIIRGHYRVSGFEHGGE